MSDGRVLGFAPVPPSRCARRLGPLNENLPIVVCPAILRARMSLEEPSKRGIMSRLWSCARVFCAPFRTGRLRQASRCPGQRASAMDANPDCGFCERMMRLQDGQRGHLAQAA